MSNQIDVFRNDKFARTILFTDANGDPIDITDWVVKFTIREQNTIRQLTDTTTDTGAILQAVVTVHTAPLEGKTKVTFTAAQMNLAPGVYVYDIQIQKVAAADPTTIYVANFVINSDVTRSNE
jgi:hypothetical protein